MQPSEKTRAFVHSLIVSCSACHDGFRHRSCGDSKPPTPRTGHWRRSPHAWHLSCQAELESPIHNVLLKIGGCRIMGTPKGSILSRNHPFHVELQLEEACLSGVSQDPPNGGEIAGGPHSRAPRHSARRRVSLAKRCLHVQGVPATLLSLEALKELTVSGRTLKCFKGARRVEDRPRRMSSSTFAGEKKWRAIECQHVDRAYVGSPVLEKTSTCVLARGILNAVHKCPMYGLPEIRRKPTPKSHLRVAVWTTSTKSRPTEESCTLYIAMRCAHGCRLRAARRARKACVVRRGRVRASRVRGPGPFGFAGSGSSRILAATVGLGAVLAMHAVASPPPMHASNKGETMSSLKKMRAACV